MGAVPEAVDGEGGVGCCTAAAGGRGGKAFEDFTEVVEEFAEANEKCAEACEEVAEAVDDFANVDEDADPVLADARCFT